MGLQLLLALCLTLTQGITCAAGRSAALVATQQAQAIRLALDQDTQLQLVYGANKRQGCSHGGGLHASLLPGRDYRNVSQVSFKAV